MPKTKSASQLKQGRISFTNQKRTGSASKATPKGKSPATIKRASKKEHIDSDSSESLSDEVEIIESDDDARKSTRTGRPISYEDIESDDSVEAPPPPPKKGKAKSKGKSRKAAADEDQIVETEFPIHAEGETPEHQILREFDLTYDYGPCIGMSRMERWERADKMGLNPPQKVYGILQQHDTDDYLQCCFSRHGRF
ncbi:DNA polymerase delta, subunit 4-domain-containing protein [Mucidula mucida]|nr:DNA polymerase delta, subunit 4-domain-containing protein [Mucidula mucida]